jgi:hypothetical protein
MRGFSGAIAKSLMDCSLVMRFHTQVDYRSQRFWLLVYLACEKEAQGCHNRRPFAFIRMAINPFCGDRQLQVVGARAERI